MKTYADFKSIDDVNWTKFKIIVPNESDKQELIEATRHIHDSDIDTEFVTVNQLAHLYIDEENIIVDKELYNTL